MVDIGSSGRIDIDGNVDHVVMFVAIESAEDVRSVGGLACACSSWRPQHHRMVDSCLDNVICIRYIVRCPLLASCCE